MQASVRAGAMPPQSLMTGNEWGASNGAFGPPGINPTWTTSSKDGIGTAYSTSSRIWFTVAMGILTEIYYPTIDRPQIRDAQFLITDGETFFHEQKRDLKSETVRLETHTLGYHITSSDPQGRYRIEEELICDPHQACVLVRARLIPSPEWAGKLRVYVLVAPHLEVGGWNNSARKLKLRADLCFSPGKTAHIWPWAVIAVLPAAHADMSAPVTAGRTLKAISKWTGNLTGRKTAMWL